MPVPRYHSSTLTGSGPTRNLSEISPAKIISMPTTTPARSFHRTSLNSPLSSMTPTLNTGTSPDNSPSSVTNHRSMNTATLPVTMPQSIKYSKTSDSRKAPSRLEMFQLEMDRTTVLGKTFPAMSQIRTAPISVSLTNRELDP